MSIYVRILLPHQFSKTREIYSRKAFDKIGGYLYHSHKKFPKVLEIMNTTYTAPRRLIKTPEEIEKMRLQANWRLKFYYD